MLIKLLPIATIALFFLSGCGGSYRSSQVNTVPLETTERVIYRNFGLKATVGVLDLKVDQVNGFLNPKIRLKNMVSKTVNIEIQVKYLDEDGWEIDNEFDWIPLTLLKGEISTFEHISRTTEAKDFRVFIKLASA